MKNYRKAIKILRNDCEITSFLIDENGKTCALGALLMDMPETEHIQTTRKFKINGTPYSYWCELLYKVYDLTESNLTSSANANNSVIDDVEKRRIKVLKVLKEIHESNKVTV